MFEKFTDRAIKVIMLAQEEARKLGCGHVGTEMILLGILGEEMSFPAKILKFSGITLAVARKEVERILGRGAEFIVVEIPFTANAKRLLEQSWEQAKRLGSNHVATEHILLGLIAYNRGIAIDVLSALGADLQAIRQTLLNEIHIEAPSERAARAQEKEKEALNRPPGLTNLAQEEARRLGHNFVGTEQLLVALLREGDGVAAVSLKRIGVSLKEARVETEKIIGRGSGFVATEIPFTPRAKRVLELSWAEARELGHNYIGGEHILLGLIKEGGGVAVRVLETLGVDLSDLRHEVLKALQEKSQ